MPKELSLDQLRKVCRPEEFDLTDTGQLPGLSEMIGQDRALRAIDFGVGTKSHGFNIYVVGPSGTGRMTAIKSILERTAREMPVPDDWCYVNNFTNPNRPRAIRLSPGKGCALQHDMDELIRDLRSEIPKAFEGEEYEKQKTRIVEELRAQEIELLARLEAEAREQGFGLQRTPEGLITIPMWQGRLMSPEEYNALPPDEKTAMNERHKQMEGRLNEVIRGVSRAGKEVKRRLQDLDQRIARAAVAHLIGDVKDKYAAFPDVLTYLNDVEDDVVGNVQDFRADQEQAAPPLPGLPPIPDGSRFDRYNVNVIVDNTRLAGTPVIVERNATYFNLIGRIEHRALFGTLTTNFSMIKAGALHRANGGYLVIEARDVLTSSFTYDALKKTLENSEIRLEEPGEQYRTIATVSIEPEPIPLNVKVVMIGSPQIYHLLLAYDEDFHTLFKVKADFAVDMDRTPQSMNDYALFIAGRCSEEGLRHFDSSGVAKVVEYGSRLSEDQTKLTTRFMDIADIAREASYWASRNDHALVTGSDVQKAIQEKIYRSNMIEERLQQLMADGTIMVDVTGAVEGQVNGLSVLDMGDYVFGRPSRITVRTFTGQSGVVNIEREVKMSGRIHDKGVMILAGYLGGQYAQDQPLTLSASVTFEQLYEGVEGDSASSTELYALLSSLARLPINQQLAVTGSVNQRGEIQPIGGAIYKIEGFFDVCKAKGLTGAQGVLIPHQNVKNLMLREDIVEAVRQDLFHIYPISTIDEGIELLTGVPAGERGPDGHYPEDTVHGRVERRLRDIQERL
ncbi:MAG: AAA family ATPase, partial [Candidatus Latescibacteria bacterium]|nr:AAA family ATPase [Candidatus Latescibacterota bacterium]